MPKRSEYGVNWYSWRKTYEVYKWNWREEGTPIEPDTEAWYKLLDEIASFNFRGKNGTFTARKELRNEVPYWYGYVKREGKTAKTYIGKTYELSMERLEEAAQALKDRAKEKASAGAGGRAKNDRVAELEAQNMRLMRQLDIETRYHQDTGAYGLMAWLRKQSQQSELAKKILADRTMPPRGSRGTYEAHLRRLKYSQDEMHEFAHLWKLMLMQA